MARADSTIRVNIVGDAKSFGRAAKDAEKSSSRISGAAKTAGVAIAAAFTVDAVLDFGQSALDEADRVGDAVTRLEAQLGDLSPAVLDAASSLEGLGQSRGDVLELSARFTDLATAAHLSDAEIAANAISATEAAAALSLLGIGGGDASTVLDLIGKAAGGADKPLKELGITLDDAEVEARAMADTGKDNADALTEQELAAARMALILEKLAPRITAITEGEADLEQKQSELNAKWETFTGKVGEGLEGPLTDLLEWMLTGIEGWELFGKAMGGVRQGLDSLEGDAKAVVDTLRQLVGLLADIGRFLPGGIGGVLSLSGNAVQLNVQGGSPEVVEQAVKDAINHASGTGPLT